MFLGASGGEGAWDGEEDGFLALGEVGDGGGLELAGGVKVGEGGFRELVTDGDGGRDGGGESEGPRGVKNHLPFKPKSQNSALNNKSPFFPFMHLNLSKPL